MFLCITIIVLTAAGLVSFSNHLHREILGEILVELLTTIFIHYAKCIMQTYYNIQEYFVN